jgi:DNA-binding NtrC family response regulator
MQLRKKMELLIDEMLDGKILLGEAVAEFEKIYIEKAVKKFGPQVSRTATALGIHRNTLAKHLSGNGDQKLTPKKVKSKRVKPAAPKNLPKKTRAAAGGR